MRRRVFLRYAAAVAIVAPRPRHTPKPSPPPPTSGTYGAAYTATYG
jgi:hypothetical protein